MADTTTTTYGLTKPEVGASDDTWGTKLNTDLDLIDDLLDGTTAIAPNLSTLNIAGAAVTSTAAELNILDGVTSNATELNLLDGFVGEVGYKNIPQSGVAKTSSYSLVTTDVGQLIELGSGGSVTIPNATFSTGDVVAIFNNTSGAITITCSITTAYLGGTNTDKSSVSLATRGICNVLFISGTVCVITGNVT